MKNEQFGFKKVRDQDKKCHQSRKKRRLGFLNPHQKAPNPLILTTAPLKQLHDQRFDFSAHFNKRSL